MANLENKLTWQNFGFEVRYHVHDREYGIRDRHAHDGFYELVVVRSGSATHVHDGVKSHIESGDVYLIPPGEPHYYANARQLGIYNVLFTGTSSRGCSRNFPERPTSKPIWGSRAARCRRDTGPMCGASTRSCFSGSPRCWMRL